MDTFRELLGFLVLPLEQKCGFVPVPRTAPVTFDLVSGHLHTTYPLHFLVSLCVDVFSTESYLPATLQERDSQAFEHLLALMHLMLCSRDERIWAPGSHKAGGVGDSFTAIWSLLQSQARALEAELGLAIESPTINYQSLKLDWAGPKPEPDGPANGSQPFRAK